MLACVEFGKETPFCWNVDWLNVATANKPVTSYGIAVTPSLSWVHSSVVRAADCRSAGPWFKSGCALFLSCVSQSRPSYSLHCSLTNEQLHARLRPKDLKNVPPPGLEPGSLG